MPRPDRIERRIRYRQELRAAEGRDKAEPAHQLHSNTSPWPLQIRIDDSSPVSIWLDRTASKDISKALVVVEKTVGALRQKLLTTLLQFPREHKIRPCEWSWIAAMELTADVSLKASQLPMTLEEANEFVQEVSRLQAQLFAARLKLAALRVRQTCEALQQMLPAPLRLIVYKHLLDTLPETDYHIDSPHRVPPEVRFSLRRLSTAWFHDLSMLFIDPYNKFDRIPPSCVEMMHCTSQISLMGRTTFCECVEEWYRFTTFHVSPQSLGPFLRSDLWALGIVPAAVIRRVVLNVAIKQNDNSGRLGVHKIALLGAVLNATAIIQVNVYIHYDPQSAQRTLVPTARWLLYQLQAAWKGKMESVKISFRDIYSDGLPGWRLRGVGAHICACSRTFSEWLEVEHAFIAGRTTAFRDC